MTKTLILSIALIFYGFSLNAQTQFYSGTSDGDNISAELTWNNDETVSGSYYFISNPNRVYRISGTNYYTGVIEMSEYFNGRNTGDGTLYKTLKKGRVVWSGTIYNTDGSSSYMYLTRSR
jgi:hypothetical protein